MATTSRPSRARDAATRPERGRHGRARRSSSTPRLSLDATLEFLQLLWALDHNMHVTSKRMAVDLGLTGPQRLVVRLIGRHPDISAGELARVLHVHKSTITGIVQRLEARGLVKRATDQVDARRIHLTLSEAGRRIAGPVSGTVEAAVKRVIGSLDPELLDATRTVLERLTHELGRSR